MIYQGANAKRLKSHIWLQIHKLQTLGPDPTVDNLLKHYSSSEIYIEELQGSCEIFWL